MPRPVARVPPPLVLLLAAVQPTARRSSRVVTRPLIRPRRRCGGNGEEPSRSSRCACCVLCQPVSPSLPPLAAVWHALKSIRVGGRRLALPVTSLGSDAFQASPSASGPSPPSLQAWYERTQSRTVPRGPCQSGYTVSSQPPSRSPRLGSARVARPAATAQAARARAQPPATELARLVVLAGMVPRETTLRRCGG